MIEPVTLTSINASYEEILHDDKLTSRKKDRMLSDLMNKMEFHFKVPALKNPEFEKNNRPVIALYRKISMSRQFDDN
ncbi:hypothetical protein MKY91_20395 [Alkalicoccobacillus gibsonii]|uniref:Uncharacterized protein n=1 Tax=Alkalicoccobacillus gibsonii TaxID=79881 RepID=A0ABU9VQS8_9BACI